MKKAVSTLREVASEAGVSIAAVSKVLHGRGESVRVSSSKASEIRLVAKRLNYVPNVLARSLRTSRTHTIGLVFENFGAISDGPQFYVELLDGVAQELFARHYRLTILSEVDSEHPAADLADGRLDGVIWCKMPTDPHFVERFANVGLPCVALHARRIDSSPGVFYVRCDNRGGSHLVVDHLKKLGHERILFVMEQRETETPDALERRDGFIEACRAQGLTVDPEQDIVVWTRDADEFADWWDLRPPHTALYGWNERVAAGVLARAKELHVNVPKDLSVIGFDSTVFCESTLPPLTAVRQPIRQMASHATRLLLDLINGHVSSQTEQSFASTLDVRQSTAIVPSYRGKTSKQRL
ncbi:MAG: LacI family transcriptional regulator [Fimbriimonadaceae bacterium]|jgi:LacI family transcriptional regulator|nr:LacI family transcriptional regulator [Fimbriimonadaceae bacterium]